MANTFSTDRHSLRYPSPKRLVFALVLLPLFLVNLAVNRICMLADEVLFRAYRKQKVTKAAFIIGVPRSATTFLFNLLIRDKKNFHGFKLWELVFAPSICQKYFFLLVSLLDRKFGSPLYRLSLIFDRKVFGQFVHIHDIGITKPEEDEVLFLYNLSSIYFFYCWPRVKVLDNLLYHDARLPDTVRRRNIDFYYRCIQRHNFVFDRHDQRYFLSKNPTFIPRMESIAKRFESAKFIYPVRTPIKTIPSTISLNAHILSNFCKLPEEYPLAEQTGEFIIDWYAMAAKTLAAMPANRYLTLGFDRITGNTQALLIDLYNFLSLDITEQTWAVHPGLHEKPSYESKHKYPCGLGLDSPLVQERLKSIVSGDLLIEK